MKIEKEIKQDVFKSERQKAVVNILFTSSWITNIQKRFFKQYNVTMQQYNVLRILRGQHGKPITVASIQERMMDKMSNASRLIDKLLDKGMVERKICPNDRRQVDVTITEKGMQLLEATDPEMKKFEETFIKLDEADAQKLNELLDALRG